MILLPCCKRNNVQIGEVSRKNEYILLNNIKPVVTIDGTVFSVNNSSYDVTEKEPQINLIMNYTYINDYIFALECHINPKVSYYFVFDTEAMEYIYGFYASQISWYDDDVNSIIYAQNNIIYNINVKELYTINLEDTQYIYDLEYSEDGKSAIIMIRDSDSDSKDDLIEISFDL